MLKQASASLSTPALRTRTSAVPETSTLSVVVGIPTRGRPRILRETLADLSRQTRQPDGILVAYYDEQDIEGAQQEFPEVQFIRGTGSSGSCAQRNRLLDAAGTRFDLILIMDDDCYLQKDYLLRTVEVFQRDPGVLGATGRILENGARGPGLTGSYARSLLAAVRQVPTLAEAPPYPAFNTDGCNMAFRLGAVQQHALRFDEDMPGYAWFEDIDFSRRLLPFGTLVNVPGAQAVHLGVKVGKTSGRRYGYSQIANPLYLARKGTFPWSHAVECVSRIFAVNLMRNLAPEPYIDRRGRLLGNLLAIGDGLRGRMHPARILDL